jgi:hypothetical protein
MVMYEDAFERSAVGAITAYVIYMMITKRLVLFNWMLSRGITQDLILSLHFVQS